MSNLPDLEVFLRLVAAAVIGSLLGLNRDLHGKPTGVRTLGLVSVGAALAVLALKGGSSADISRVIQGIVTGIGFLGAGVIVRTRGSEQILGLTTAACVWVTACLGAACGVANWSVVFLGLIVTLVILIFGGAFERAVHHRLRAHQDHE